MIWRGEKGEMERRQGAFIGVVQGRNGRAFNGNLIGEGSYYGEETVTSVVSGPRLKMTGGSHLSVKGRGGERGWAVPVRCAPGGSWVATGIGPKGSPEVHFYLFIFNFFSSFLFLFS
jgi:hypothetical protein